MTGHRLVEKVGALMVSALASSNSGLAKFRDEFERHAVARDRSGTCRESLPISLNAIEASKNWSVAEGAWLSYICFVLNYQFCGGQSNKKFMEHTEELNAKQMQMIGEHLLPAISRMCKGDQTVPLPEE